MATATLYFVSSISGNVTTPANALGAPDGVYTTDTGSTNWTHRWRLDTVADSQASGTQTLTLRVRRSGTGNGSPP